MLLRILIVIAAYALSGAGFLMMILGAFPFLGGEFFFLAKFVPLVWLFALYAQARMSWAWICNRTLSRGWPIWGTAAGLFSLASPLLLLVGPTESGHNQLGSVLFTIGFVALFLLPGILLAVKLVRFHLDGND